MSIAAPAIKQLENSLPKIIDAKTHGIIDYAHVTLFLSMALVCRKKNPRAALAALLTGCFVLVESLLTNYPLGVSDVIPFEAHGRMDAGFAASSYLIPRIFDFKGTAAGVFKANAFVEAAVVGLTDFNSDHARQEEAEA